MIPFFGTTGWQIGFLKIQSWGLFVSLGFLIGTFLASWLVKKQKLNKDRLLNLLIWIIIASLVGGRLFYVFLENSRNFYLWHPLEIFKIWQGGLDSFGGFAGVGIILFWFWYKKKIDWHYLDILAFVFPFGWTVGRMGCLLIHDHLGVLFNSFLAINFTSGPRLDMALLEILMLVPLLIIFALKGLKMLSTSGLLSSRLFLWYGMGRFLLDFLRADDIAGADARYGGFTVAQWGSLILVFIGLKLLKKIKKGRFA
ncbi:MAG: Prolipoprotein diacylglyceryl transferase [Candidatus Magasanikbacteria bacterium GW2011_GWC2_40_17]|uniref:Prolipoprotein diacylglyceryl transferase n=1 Tax=Candidatus Magasanikbacteria bacterium GW2011_GWA2_42_32 TaxID=1619039 RepID=A0A0G1A929_9BACT|nr:MAG: Prolipoprotein diacylglyceryl transferase [Candidatus Magasanikbacteria bacterium GW2011_GWC2_40_17]KKS57540.1 MAG: Prolipoprotein diacylglyceryl transferase [Candidatus Magasanikbacteria bacterium GW2011_GWA2_42_32]OGH85255.1 MAG: hypothetical protein A2294_00730 [Candidatus Magasanikbacteria bacterium RIFOXYB2_FULL_38_10]